MEKTSPKVDDDRNVATIIFLQKPYQRSNIPHPKKGCDLLFFAWLRLVSPLDLALNDFLSHLVGLH